jgi:hypothetical protein
LVILKNVILIIVLAQQQLTIAKIKQLKINLKKTEGSGIYLCVSVNGKRPRQLKSNYPEQPFFVTFRQIKLIA